MTVSVAGSRTCKAFYHLTDNEHIYTEIPLFPAGDGTVRLTLANNAIALLEL